MILTVALSVGLSIAFVWLALILFLFAVKPDTGSLRDILWIVPDVVRLVHRLGVGALATSAGIVDVGAATPAPPERYPRGTRRCPPPMPITARS